MNTKPSLKRLSANMIKNCYNLLIYFIKELRKYSFRDTVFYLEEILGEAIDFPNLRYCILKSFSRG